MIREMRERRARFGSLPKRITVTVSPSFLSQTTSMLRFTLSRATYRSQLRPPLSVSSARSITSTRPRADLDWRTDAVKDGTKIGKEEHRFHFSMVLLTLMPFVCTGLGIWQVNRLNWKVSLIEDLNDKLQRAPMMLPRNVKFVYLCHYRKYCLASKFRSISFKQSG